MKGRITLADIEHPPGDTRGWLAERLDTRLNDGLQPERLVGV